MNKLKQNPLKNRKDIVSALEELLYPLKGRYTESGIDLIATGVGYGEKTAKVETMLRLLWGLVPLEASGEHHEQSQKVLNGIINGTNPKHSDYWGEIQDYDQLIVEMAAIGYMLLLAPKTFWSPLNDQQKQNLANYINQVNTVEAHDCNWLFFAVLVNLGLKNVGEEYNQEVIEHNLSRIDDYYIGEGWYKDGIDAHIDYYVPFAIHFYSLVYAVAMEEEDPERCKRYKERAKIFSKKFVYWFSKEGQGVPYGRSMTYRFSQVAFFSAYIFADVDSNDTGWMKGIILRHLRYWLKQPILYGDGTLSVGYTYPNLHMSENYNAPGSPYWSLKSFLILLFPEDHPFWKIEEQALPNLDIFKTDTKAEQTIVRDGKHVLLFPNGYKHFDYHNHTHAKYEKFVYSSHFGFSVPRSSLSLSEGAFDSMLALSEEGEYFRVKRQVTEKEYKENNMYMKWNPWKDVTVETWIIPGAPWHVRIHRIQSERTLYVADNGFALGKEPKEFAEVIAEEQYYAIQNEKGTVATVDLLKTGKTASIHPNSNTNLLYPNTIIPMVNRTLKPGENLLIHGFYGSVQPKEKLTELINGISYEDKILKVNGKEVTLDFLTEKE